MSGFSTDTDKELVKELGELLITLPTGQADQERIREIFVHFKVHRDSLELDATVQCEMERDLGYFVSKYERLMRRTETELKKEVGLRLKGFARRELPKHQLDALIDADPEVADLKNKFIDYSTIHGLVKNLHGSMRNRDSMITYFRKLDYTG